MEVKINIESNQISDTVIDLFKNLSPEKKEELAAEIVKKYLDEKVTQKIGWGESMITEISKKIDSYFLNDITKNETFIETKEKCIEYLTEKMPEIVMQGMIIAFVNDMGNMRNAMLDSIFKSYNLDAKINETRSRLGLPTW